MIRTIRIRLEPNNKQKSKMIGSAGVGRWAYNWVIKRQDENWKKGGKFLDNKILRKEITKMKKEEDFKWLNNYSNNITKQAVKDACGAYRRFFKKTAKKPVFKSRKKDKGSFYQDIVKMTFTETHVRLEKIGWVKLSEKGRIKPGEKIYNPRVKYDGLHWYLTVGVDLEYEKPKLTGKSIGIDLGIKELAVVSSIPEAYHNINKSAKVKKLKKRLRRLQRSVSRKYIKNKKGGSYCKTCNIIKTENRILKLNSRLNNIRNDYQHKVTNEIVRTKPSRIVMETLNIKGMMKNMHLAKAIQEQGLYEFTFKMKYKCENLGIELVFADKWFPSSKMCSCCGRIKPKLSLSERIYKCSCGMEMDRDKNASINLAKYEVA